MMLVAADWQGILGWNLKLVGALWAAWSGGVSTAINERFALVAYGIEFTEDFSAFTVFMKKKRNAADDKPEPKLKLVP